MEKVNKTLDNLNISDIVKNNISISNELLNKRLKFLKKFSEKQKKEGYRGLNDLRIENNSVLIDNTVGDCRYDDKFFYVSGSEGVEEVELTSIDFLKKIKKLAREQDCGGLK